MEFIFLIFGVFTIFIIYSYRKNKKYMSENNISVQETLTHVSGLPIADGVSCEVSSYPDIIKFKSGNVEINLNKEKLVDVSTKTDTEIQNFYSSSIGRAVGGAILFGPLGAVIGGRKKKKSIKRKSNYLIFTYKKDDELSYIVFDVTKNLGIAYAYIKDFKTLQKQQTIIDI